MHNTSSPQTVRRLPPLRRGRWRTAGALVTAGLALALAGCSSEAQAPSPGGGGATAARGGGGPTVPVSVVTVEEKAMPLNLQAVGNVEASSTVEVRAQVAGLLTSVNFKEGDEVAAGQKLFTIDPRQFVAALNQAKATLAKDTAQAKNAQAILVRDRNLRDDGLLPPADYETAVANAASLDATLQADQAQVENATLQLQYATITAPIAGRTGALLVHLGSLIRANDTNPLVVINQVSPVYVSFAVPSRQLATVRKDGGLGLPVEAVVAGSSVGPSTGVTSFIDNVVDPSTDTIRMKARFDNRDHRLWPGQFVEVTMRLSVDPHAVVVPTIAVQPGQSGTYVWVVNADATAAVRQVAVSRTLGEESVIASGLRAGETVVTDGQVSLTPGAHVAVKPAVGDKAS